MKHTYAPNATISKTWRRTDALRWRQDQNTRYLDPLSGMMQYPPPILEQGWWCQETGETEWRVVETVNA